jgi:hypothetical protein
MASLVARDLSFQASLLLVRRLSQSASPPKHLVPQRVMKRAVVTTKIVMEAPTLTKRVEKRRLMIRKNPK